MQEVPKKQAPSIRLCSQCNAELLNSVHSFLIQSRTASPRDADCTLHRSAAGTSSREANLDDLGAPSSADTNEYTLLFWLRLQKDFRPPRKVCVKVCICI